MIATIWEVWNDRKGDFNKGEDVFIRIIYLCGEAIIIGIIFNKPFIDSLLVSTSFFFLVFDYAIAYVLIKNGTLEPPKNVKYHWFSYQAKSGVFDNFKTWRNLSPWGKLGIKLGFFVVSMVIYIEG